jgi:ribosomal protein S18 acetylase RimI-like enzyme
MIRAAALEDLADLVEVNWQVQQMHLAARPAVYRDSSRDEIADRFRELLADAGQAILIDEVEGDLRGFVVIRRVDNPGNTYALPRVTAHVDMVGVRDDARRAGHGRALMAAAEAQARAWGADAVSLEVQWFNDDAVKFYQALGYAITSCRMARPI